MDLALVPILASIVVGAVLVVAGAMKLAAGRSWVDEAKALGAPAWSVPVVPWFELVLGALLVGQVARRPLAATACVLFIVFTAFLLRVMGEGRRPVCACFGAWSARPLGRGHVVRNIALIGASIVALA